jgi:hypothetical protein
LDIDSFIATLDGDLAPVRSLAGRFRSPEDQIDADNNVLISHRPNIAPEAYAIVIYPPLSPEMLGQYQRIHSLTISRHLLPILETVNGFSAFEFALFGAPQSMAKYPTRVDRSGRREPFDIATADQIWKFGCSFPSEWFYFGSGPYSHTEHVGYLVDSSGTIHAVRRNGTRLGSWTSFRQFLTDELKRSEWAFPVHETFLTKLRSQLG